MVTLEINGRRVQVDDAFRDLSPEEQQSTVEEIARSIGVESAGASDGIARDAAGRPLLQAGPGDEDLSAPSVVPSEPERDPTLLPGIAGDVQANVRAFDTGVTQGATFGMADEIAAAAATPIQMIADRSLDIPAAYGNALGGIRQGEASIREAAPVAGTVGDIAGAVGGGIGLARGGVTLMNGARPNAVSMGGRGAVEGGLYGAAHGFGTGESMDERLGQAAVGGLQGAALGGVLGAGAGALASRGAQNAVPTLHQLDEQSTALYNAARQSGAQLPQQQASQMAANMRNIAQAEGIITPTGNINQSYQKIGPLIQSFDDYATGSLNVDQMQAVRKLIGNALKSTDADERRIAMAMMDEFHKFLDPIAPQIAQANQLYRQMKTGEMIDTAIELAVSRSGQFSGSGFENALRTEFRALERQIIKGQLKGLSPEMVSSITNVARGGPVENSLRALGKLAPTGIVSLGMTSGVPYYIGNSLGGPVAGGLAAGATMGAGFAGRQAATSMTLNNARVASAVARSGGAALQASPAMRALAAGGAALGGFGGASLAQQGTIPMRALIAGGMTQ
jgi:hypothetical protein